MVPESDPVLEFLERWKKRVFAAFLLIASIFGATALLILEYGVVEKAWGLEFAAGAVANIAPGPAPVDGSPPKNVRKKQREAHSGCGTVE